VQHQVVLPAGDALHQVAYLVLRRARLHHAAQAERTHHLADCHRRQVLRDVAHPHAVGRVHRDIQHAHQHFAVLQRGHGLFDQVEIFACDQAFGAGLEAQLAIELGHAVHRARGMHSTIRRRGAGIASWRPFWVERVHLLCSAFPPFG